MAHGQHWKDEHDIKSGFSNDHASIPINVRAFGQGSNPIAFEFDARKLDYPEFTKTGSLSGSIYREGDRFDLEAQISAEGEFECTRCAETFQERITAPLHLQFVPASLVRDIDDPNVIEYDPLSSQEVDILGDIRDALVLAIPMKHLCRPDCKGVCPVCGKNKNVEACDCIEKEDQSEAWSALNGLRERLRAEEVKQGDRN